MKIGETHMVPNFDGKDIPARLCSGLVLEAEKIAHCVYRAMDDHHFVVQVPLTDVEIEAWKRHPDTFFGEVQPAQNRQANNWLELAMFFYETYKTTPKDRLLDWMKAASDIDYLRSLSQLELAIEYCERLGLGAYKPMQAPTVAAN
jgi:hypothetical protein